MEALFMFGLVSATAIAIVGGLYFWRQDKKEAHKREHSIE